tara:strand:+ start:660 stop:920 length:261 start_codon:yes stop_codon:yes gene_type:complete
MTYIAMIDGVETTISQAELDEIFFMPPATEGEIRSKRDGLIASTDWWALPDRTMTAEQTAYRQALRDITSQAGFPTDITWPQEPSA